MAERLQGRTVTWHRRERGRGRRVVEIPARIVAHTPGGFAAIEVKTGEHARLEFVRPETLQL